MNITAIIVASFVWFLVAGILFFNPIVDKIYRSQENQNGVRALPKSPKTIGMILIAILIQVIMWAGVYGLINNAIPGNSRVEKGLIFGLILIVMKMIPRDIDRILLSTYPKKRMIIEFIIGAISCLAVGVTFGYLII